MNESEKVEKIDVDHTVTAARFRRTSSSAAAIAFFDSLSFCHSSLDRLMMDVFSQMDITRKNGALTWHERGRCSSGPRSSACRPSGAREAAQPGILSELLMQILFVRCRTPLLAIIP